MGAGPSIAVRHATEHDAAALADIGARTFRDTFGPDNTERDMAAYVANAFSPDIQASEIADPSTTVLLAHLDGTVVGYARLRRGEAPPCIVGARPIEIVRFYADTPWIGRGVGAVLMSACLAEVDHVGCDTVWLDVWERNPRAIAFYGKWGFVRVGKQKFVLGDDVQQDLLMARPVRKE